jgi:hypothetical protein
VTLLSVQKGLRLNLASPPHPDSFPTSWRADPITPHSQSFENME